MLATSSSVSRTSGSRAAARRPASRAASAAPADPASSPSRQVATQSTGSAARLSLRYSSTASVSGSAQWRSSRISSRPAPGKAAQQLEHGLAADRR